jgi:hypothetical protein
MQEGTNYSTPGTNVGVSEVRQAMSNLTDVRNSQSEQVSRLSENTSKVQDLGQLLDEF